MHKPTKLSDSFFARFNNAGVFSWQLVGATIFVDELLKIDDPVGAISERRLNTN